MQNRICPYCAETVKAEAKVCPKCRQWLTFYSIMNPAMFILAFSLCLLAVGAGFLLIFKRLTDPGVSYEHFPGSLSIVESRMNLKNDKYGQHVSVVCVVTNKSELAWDRVQIEARFFDKGGGLIDAESEYHYGIILPHDEVAFRVSNTAYHDLGDYDSYKVFVRGARDARSHF